jgi:RHS repeat-associated protein
MNNLTGAVTKYTYDKAGRLTKAIVTGGPYQDTYTYTYDARGNRLTASGGTTPQNFSVNAANQISSGGYTYDGAGNLTEDPNGTYDYNGAEQMTSVTKGGATYNYTYAGASQNEVLSQTTPDGTYNITYGRTDAHGQPIIEQYKKDSATAYVEHDPVTGEALMLRTSSGMQSLYVYDGTGNPAALITSASYRAFAYEYDPYGAPTITANSGGLGTSQNPYMFKAGIQDRVTGWVKFGARWYSPALGRWTQHDTLDAPLDPANANRYAFAANDPINNSDPTGRNLFGTVVGSLVGGAITTAGTGAVCALTAVVGCLVGAAAFGALGGAILGGANAASDGASKEEAGIQTALGAVGGAIANVFGRL